LLSGHRSYFYEQKVYFQNEISRIAQLYDKANYKKSIYKKKVNEIIINSQREKERLEKDIEYFRDKVCFI